MPTTTVRDFALYYEMAGNGDPPLLFIHGMCGGSDNWRDQISRLSPEFTCVAYDRRGHSRSETGTEDQSDRTHTDDAAALIEALGLDRPVVVGASSGGIIATELMRRYPDRVRGAVLMEPPLLGLDPAGAQELMAELGPLVETALAEGGQRKAVDVFFGIICSRFWEQADETTRDRVRDNAPMLFATLNRLAADITREDLESIEHPVLYMAATDSPEIHRTINEIVMEHLPHARRVDFEDCAHVIYAEKPEQFAQAVREFAREVMTTPAATRTR